MSFFVLSLLLYSLILWIWFFEAIKGNAVAERPKWHAVQTVAITTILSLLVAERIPLLVERVKYVISVCLCGTRCKISNQHVLERNALETQQGTPI